MLCLRLIPVLLFPVFLLTASAIMAKEPAAAEAKPGVTTESFGKLSDGREAKLFTLTNKNGLSVKVTDYGATLVSVEAPDRDGKKANVVLGFDSVGGYAKGYAFFGSTVGRYANRIAKGKFTLDGKEYKLALNDHNVNHLHGGPKAFDKQIWESYEHTIWKANGKPAGTLPGVTFSLVSKDGDEGYPGTLRVSVDYRWNDNNELNISYRATTDKKTVINLTNHAYWNLAGAGKRDVLDHKLKLFAHKYVDVDQELIPTGEIKSVKGTPLDFTEEHKIGERIKDSKPIGDTGPHGYDNCFVLDNDDGDLALAARVTEPESGRVMEVLTTEPSVQLYTANYLGGDAANGGFKQFGAFCLETSHLPDSPNHKNFPSTVLTPDDEYTQTTVHRFSVAK